MARPLLDSWLFWALLAALFASLTAIFGKVGVTGVDPDFATLLRVVVILAFAGVLVVVRGAAQPLTSLAPRTLIFLGLSGLATGRVVALLLSGAEPRAGCAGGAHRQAERGAGRHHWRGLSGRAPVAARLAGRGDGGGRRGADRHEGLTSGQFIPGRKCSRPLADDPRPARHLSIPMPRPPPSRPGARKLARLRALSGPSAPAPMAAM